jgi:hypothetical protein
MNNLEEIIAIILQISDSKTEGISAFWLSSFFLLESGEQKYRQTKSKLFRIHQPEGRRN